LFHLRSSAGPAKPAHPAPVASSPRTCIRNRGPSLATWGTTNSRQGAIELARVFGDILVQDDAQARFEKLVAELAELRVDARNATSEKDELARKLAALEPEFAKAVKERDEAVAKLAATKSSAAIVSRHVSEFLKPKETASV
jgi:hypothetical protein